MGNIGSQRIILAIDASNEADAKDLIRLAKEAGAQFIKLGLELSSATSWQRCSELAQQAALEWVADAKLDDIPNTVKKTVANIKNLAHPPFAITIHTTAGIEAMRAAQAEAGDIKMFGVTILTSISDEESSRIFGAAARQKVMDLALMAAEAGLAGFVASPQELGRIKENSKTKHLLAMIPGTRSDSATKNDQARTATPAEAIKDGADLLVIGRQVTQAADPAKAYKELTDEIEGAP